MSGDDNIVNVAIKILYRIHFINHFINFICDRCELAALLIPVF